MTIKLGQEVRDRVTGFKGIVTVKLEFINGCRRVEVQPKVDKKGEMLDSATFDEPNLEVIGDGILPKEEKASTHGDPDFKAKRMGH